MLLLGGFELTAADGRPIAVTVKKARALLCWLALQVDHDHPRERLASLLWSDSSEQQARHSLRQALSALRKASPVIARALAAGHDHVRLESGVIEVDALVLEQRAQHTDTNDVQQLLGVYRGDFLEGMNAHSPPFDDWLMERRNHFRQLAANRFEEALLEAMNGKRFADAIRLGIRLVNLEPLREDVHRALMQCYAAAGRIPDALQQYRLCRAILEREIGVAPSAQTESLKIRLMSQRGREPATVEAAVREEPSNAPPRRRPELRQVTLVAAAPLSESDRLDPQREDRALSQLSARCAELARQEGLVAPIVGGHCVVLVFGSPTTSSNDSMRAVNAALALSKTGDSRIAVASGRAVVHPGDGADGAAIRRVSGAVLRQVETMCDFPGPANVVISEPVRLSCIDHVSVTGPLAQELPGGIRTWRLESMDMYRPVRPLPGFIGRRLELGQLKTMLDFCRDGGHGHVFMIRGDAGIGKSRLVHKAMDEAAGHGDLCVQYRVGAPAGTGYVGLAAGLLKKLIEWRRDDPVAEPETAQVREYLGSLGIENELVAFAAALLTPIDEASRIAVFENLDAEGRRALERRLLESLVRRVVIGRSLVLLVEDIHWAERKLLTQLAGLAALTTSHRLVLAMTSRHEGEALSATWRGAMSGAPMTTIDLQPLPAAECRRLAERLAGSQHPRLDDCVMRSAGNPLFLEQLLLAADHGDLALPDSIQSIVGARLDALTPTQRDVVRAAAVLGVRFPFKALQHMLPGYDSDFDGLLAHGLLFVSGTEARFPHELIHRGIYDATLREDLKALHRRAASFYESIDDYRFAWHVVCTGGVDMESTCERVVERLLAVYAFERAAVLLDRALAESPHAHRLVVLRGRVFQLTGANLEAIGCFEKALSIESTPQAAINLVEVLIILDRYEEALSHLARLDSILANEDHESRAKAEILASRIAFSKGYISRCLTHGKNAVTIAHRAGCVELEIESTSTMADARYQQGQMHRARELFDECVALAAEHDSPAHQAINLAMRGWVNVYLGHIEKGFDDCLQANRLATRIGHRRHQALTTNVLAQVCYECGVPERGIGYARASLEICQSIGSIRFELESRGLVGYYECVRGDRNDGFLQILDAARRMVDLRPAYAGPWLLGIAGFFAPDHSTARELFDEGERILGEIDCVSHNPIHFFQHAIARMLLEDDANEARRLLDRFDEYLDSRDIPAATTYCRRCREMLDAPSDRRTSLARAAFSNDAPTVGLNFRSIGLES